MATYAAPIDRRQKISGAIRYSQFNAGLLLSVFLTFCAVIIQGYHPFAEDGGIYIAAVEHRINPALFPYWTQFISEPTRYSMFASLISKAVHLTRIPLPAMLWLLHLSTIWLTIFAAWLLAKECLAEQLECIGAVCLFAFSLGVPVAGTALVIMDPYLTARSFSTPAMILSLLGVLEWTGAESYRRRRGQVICLCALAAGFLLHPLMTAYSLGATLILGLLRSPSHMLRRWGPPVACFCSFVCAATLQWAAPPESTHYIRIALTRTYWFLSQWHGYEIIGLIAPLAILAITHRSASRFNRRTSEPTNPLADLALAALWVGGTSILVALVFARPSLSVHLVARLQPLRAFQFVYFVMTLVLGAALAREMLHGIWWRWCAAFCLLGGIMFAAARNTFPDLPHIELRESSDSNPWVQAFLWIRTHTPGDSLFALDADYIHSRAEDAQCFRALAQRSALADDSKDGGEASIAPDLANQWTIAHDAQIQLDNISDSERLARLQPLGVSWMVLRGDAPTHLPCPYANAVAKVCRLE